MTIETLLQCGRDLNFRPRKPWPSALPTMAWNRQILCGFERQTGSVLRMDEKDSGHFVDLWRAIYPELGLGELARASHAIENLWPELWREWREGFFGSYQLRWSDRLDQTLVKLRRTPLEFQNWVDEKKISVRDLSPVLALPDILDLEPLFQALPKMVISRFEGARALELVIELFLMGRPLNDLLPTSDNGSLFVRRLEKWRRPQAETGDEEWRKTVNQWPWPAQVQAEWQRFGDQAGIEIKIRATSPEDFQKKLERLQFVPEQWSCKS